MFCARAGLLFAGYYGQWLYMVLSVLRCQSCVVSFEHVGLIRHVVHVFEN